jgi:ATP-binding cassette subfamily C (CFTR/MRP) protein 1
MICIAQPILITTSSKFVAAFMPAAVIVLYLLQRFYLRSSRQIRLLDLEAKSPMDTHFLETLSGLYNHRAFNWQSHGMGVAESCSISLSDLFTCSTVFNDGWGWL